jgi:hypothetical protein
MQKNVGGIDKILRIVIGVALLAGYVFNSEGSYSWLYLLGIIPLATGLMGSCLLYRLVGINTCPVNKD